MQDKSQTGLPLQQLFAGANCNDSNSQRIFVDNLRKTAISGVALNIRPFRVDDCSAIVTLRNDSVARYFLNQETPSTEESQLVWASGYFKRTNDVFWILEEKSGKTIGCNRIYNIDAGGAEKGSLIVDRNYSLRGPYVLEAELIALTICFKMLNLDYVTTTVKEDNYSMQSINSRFGFKRYEQIKIRDADYAKYMLQAKDFDPENLWLIVNHWKSRL